jgi:putative phosphoribosyl transferase
MTPVRTVRIPVARDEFIEGDLTIPTRALGVVVFAHGSGSGRHSPRNRLVAARLNDRGLATLLVDLLTLPEEEVDARTRHLRFDIGLLSARLLAVASWVQTNDATRELRLGYFGASTGAAAALVAAAAEPASVSAVVSRGGRPDLAGSQLARVTAPTLLLVGSLDRDVLELNRTASEAMHAERRLVVVPGASHLFEEPGTLEEAARLAGDWFVDHLPAGA